MNKNRIIAISVGIAFLSVTGLCVLTGINTYNLIEDAQSAGVRWPGTARVSASMEESLSFENTAGKTLVLSSDAGNVHIVPVEGSTMLVDVTKTSWGVDEEDALAQVEFINVQAIETSTSIELKFEWKNEYEMFSIENGRNSADFAIQLPADMLLDLQVNAGDVSLDGLETAAEIDVQFGDVKIKTFTGSLKIDNRNGQITLAGVNTGENSLEIQGEFGGVSGENISGNALSLDMRNGKIVLSDVEIHENFVIHNEFGDVTLKRISAENLEINVRNMNLVLEDVTLEKSLTVEQEFGDAKFTQVFADQTTVTAKNTTFKIAGFRGLLQLGNEFGDVNISQADELILDISMRNGNFNFSGTLDSTKTHSISNEFGYVKLDIPADSSFDADFDTEFGKIQSSLPITFTEGLDEEHWIGSLNEGGTLLKISTRNGDIEINTLD